MKKLLLVLLMLCGGVLAFAQKSNDTNYFFQYTFGDINCNPDWSFWQVSHGSPSYADYGNAKLVSSNANGINKSEGLFVDYNFSKNNNYQIYFVFNGSSGSSKIEVYGANGLVANKAPDCNEAVLPNADKQLIESVLVYSGYLYNVTIPTDKPYWNPNKNYNYFWISSHNEGSSGHSLLNMVTIKDFGKVESNPPTTPGNLRTTSVKANEIKIEWDPSTDDTRVAGYEVSLNNNFHGTTASTTYTIPRLTQCTNYTIKVRAFDPYDNYSQYASLSVQTPIDLPSDLILSSPINLAGQERIEEATNTITLKAGFSVKANSAQERFHAKISTGCSNIFSFIPEEEEPYFEDDDIFATQPPDVNGGYISETLKNEPFDTTEDILIYSNPTSNMITVEYHQFIGAERVSIFDMMGKSLFDYKLSDVISNIDVSAFPPGIYFIKIITGDQVFVRKLVKQ